MMIKSLLLLLSLLMLVNAQAGELYRSIDKDGKVHYSDSPLAGSEDVERLKLEKEPVPDESLPYETQRAMQNFPVTLYIFPGCGSPCQLALEFLSKRGVPYTEKNLQSKEEMDAYSKLAGDTQLPAATIGKTWLKGFQAEQWNNELDYAGYPKSAPAYHPRPAASAIPPTK
jgi:hypothetical protein